jgi:phosphatidate cytidylyltransferase
LALKRELAAAVAIPIVLGVLFFLPPIWFDFLVAAIALAALWEFFRIAEKTGLPVAKSVGVLGWLIVFGGWLLGMSTSMGTSVILPCFVGVVALGFLCAVASLFGGVDMTAAMGGAGATMLGIWTIAVPAVAMCMMRADSPTAVLLLFFIVWGCDSFAYYTGKNFGKHKLAPRISPNKTWEGTIGGLVGATLIGAAGGTWWLAPQLGPGLGALAGALASTAGQIGDLVESMWKRGANVKDSGTFLPGHGGFYDRVDSLLFAGPVLAAILFWRAAH